MEGIMKAGNNEERELTFEYRYNTEEGSVTEEFKVELTEEQVKRLAVSYVDRKCTNMEGDDNIFDIYCKVCDEIMQIKEREGLATDKLFEDYIFFPKEIDAIVEGKEQASMAKVKFNKDVGNENPIEL